MTVTSSLRPIDVRQHAHSDVCHLVIYDTTASGLRAARYFSAVIGSPSTLGRLTSTPAKLVASSTQLRGAGRPHRFAFMSTRSVALHDVLKAVERQSMDC